MRYAQRKFMNTVATAKFPTWTAILGWALIGTIVIIKLLT